MLWNTIRQKLFTEYFAKQLAHLVIFLNIPSFHNGDITMSQLKFDDRAGVLPRSFDSIGIVLDFFRPRSK